MMSLDLTHHSSFITHHFPTKEDSMNAELAQAVMETRSLALEHGWDRVAEAADAVLTGQPEGAVLLATPAEGEVGGLPRWIAETAPTLQLQKITLEVLAADPLPAAL